MLPSWVRWLAFGVGAFLILAGFAVGAAGDVAVGAETIVLGAVALIVSLLQRPRYRSNTAEVGHDDAGPGGGESGFMEPRFLPTNEVFVDPTSHRLMRVFADPRTGERRYRAES